MRIGVFLGTLTANAGGAFSVQRTVIRGLTKIKSPHEIVIFYYGEVAGDLKGQNFKLVQMVPRARKLDLWRDKAIEWVHPIFTSWREAEVRRNPLLVACETEKIHFMWFPTNNYEYVSVPFAYTLWDIQHRIQPFFPEVSVTGADWKQREDWYWHILPRASFLIVSNEVAREDAIRAYGIHPDRFILAHQPTTEFSTTVASDKDILAKHDLAPGYLFYPAQFWSHKNHITVLKALAHLKGQGHEYVLVLTGADKGNLCYVKDFARSQGLESQVKYLGFVPDEEVPSLYKNSKCLVFASMFGPENQPPLEALSFGIPVICSAFSGASEQLGSSVFYFNPTDPHSLASAIVNLDSDPKLLAEKARLGAEIVSTRTDANYVRLILGKLSEFEPIREMWSPEQRYVHP